MSIEIVTADRGHMHFVLDHLRELDARELQATGADLLRLPDHIMRYRIFVFCAYDFNDGPLSIWGMTRQRRGVGSGFAFGTDRWGKALPVMVRQIRNFVLPYLVTSGFHRVEAAALAHRTDVTRFMALIGAQPEAVLRGWGTGGEDFISYRWLADEYRGSKFENVHTAH